MLRVTPVYGSRWDESGPATSGHCTLVEYAGVKVLLDVGRTSDPDLLQNLPEHDCLLLTDSTLEHMGSLPLYYSATGNRQHKAMYATFPTLKMGQMTLYDHHANLCLDGERPPFSLEDMDAAISQLHTIKYSQPIALPSKENPLLTITAHQAGHVVGGAFYLLQRLQDETSVVITGTYHIAKELHLDSSSLLKYGATPDVLITEPGGPAMPLLGELYSQKKMKPPLVTQSQRNLVEQVLSVLRRDGNVLLPVDASGRVLELLLLLRQHWERHRLSGTYNLVWLGPMVVNTLDFARSQLEWMASALGHQFDQPGNMTHPYHLKGIVEFCTSTHELDELLAKTNNPTCVLASGLDLDHGPARDLLVKWAHNDNHAILFTDSSQCVRRTLRQLEAIANTAVDDTKRMDPGVEDVVEDEDGGDGEEGGTILQAIVPKEVSPYSTAYQLLRHWCQAKLEDREMEDSVAIDVLIPRRVPLTGTELQTFLEQEEAQRLSRKQQEEQEAMLREVELAKGRLRLGEQESETAKSLSAVDQSKSRLFLRPKKKSRFDSSLFLKFSKPLHLTFEVREDAVGVGQKDSVSKFGIGESVGNSEVLEDDYGIAVIPEHFVDIVTGVDPSKYAGGTGRIGEEVLRRGLGYGVGDLAGDVSGMSAVVPGSKRRENGSPDEGDQELDERAMEATDLSEGTGIVRGRNGRPPAKITTVPRMLQVFAEVDYIPLEGRVDSRAARQSVRALQPRQVVVLGGKREKSETEDAAGLEKDSILKTDEVSALASASESVATARIRVQTPSDHETVELNVGHAAYSARLIANPYRTQEEKEREEEPPHPIELREAKLGACTVSLLDFVATGKKVALDGSIVLAPRKTRSSRPSLYVSDGDVLLTDLRTELIAQGMKAEYSTHSSYTQLVVNGKVVVKKENDSGKLDVEGPLCEDFFSVRAIVCGQFVTL